MKLKSLILGSVAAAGLSTAGYAADLGVLTSLDVCDSLGISGLTLSSSDNCLVITGGVEYEFVWGDYEPGTTVFSSFADTLSVATGNDLNDWDSTVEAWVQFVGTAPSDFGPASVTIKLLSEDSENEVIDEVYTGGYDNSVNIDEAYVSIGDTTVIMAGKKGSIAVQDDDQPFNYLGLFSSEANDEGVWLADGDYLGGHVIQVVSEVGNGFSVGAALENLQGETTGAAGDLADEDGTAVGVLQYAGPNVTAHLTAAAIGILDGDVDQWAMHAGATGTFDMFKVRGAVGYNYFDAADDGILTALVSAEAGFDMFTIALSGEYLNDEVIGDEGYGIGGSIGAAVTEGVAINLGGRYFNFTEVGGVDADADTWQIAAQIVADLTETITATGEIGVFGGDIVEAGTGGDEIYYGAAELGWAPGGDFTSSIRGEVNSEDAYKVTFKAAKSFK